MKVKDLPTHLSLKGTHVKTSNGQTGYMVGIWQKGVWLCDNESLSGTVIPVFLEDLKECLEWEVLEDKTTEV